MYQSCVSMSVSMSHVPISVQSFIFDSDIRSFHVSLALKFSYSVNEMRKYIVCVYLTSQPKERTRQHVLLTLTTTSQ